MIPSLLEYESMMRDAITAPDTRSQQVKIGASERLEAHFLENVRITDYCWIWTGTLSREGYGVFTHRVEGNRWQLKAHRVSWKLFYGAPDPDLTIDHICWNKRCVNPDHLEQVTVGANVSRFWQRRRDFPPEHCVHGHEMTPENTRIVARGTRTCITCEREKDRRSREKRSVVA